MEIQVEKDHYELKNYVNTERWHSYYNQLCEIIAVTQNRGGVFIIGKGDGIVGAILNSVYHFRVIYFDFDASLEPDIVGMYAKNRIFQTANLTRWSAVRFWNIFHMKHLSLQYRT